MSKLKEQHKKMYDLLKRMVDFDCERDTGGNVSFVDYFMDEIEKVEKECRPNG